MSNFFKTDFDVIFNKNTRISNELFIYEVGFENCKPSKNIEYVPIDYYLIHYCIEGEGILELYGYEKKISKGSLFLIPPKVKNRYKPIEENPWSYCWIGINGIFAKDVIENCGFSKEKFVLKDMYDKKIINFFQDIYDAFINNKYLKSVGSLYLFLDYLTEKNFNYPQKLFSSKENYLKDILEYIHKNYDSKIKISEISSNMNIDRTYIYKLFKTYLNMSPQQYILNYRLEKSIILLKRTNLSVTQISEKCGFNTYTYFINQFKKYTNRTPIEYRKKYINI